MGYRITYNQLPLRQKTTKRIGFRTMVAGCLLLFLLSVRLWWPEGRAVMEHFLLPAEIGDVQTVLTGVVEDIRNGDSLSEVVGAFCREIIADAQID